MPDLNKETKDLIETATLADSDIFYVQKAPGGVTTDNFITKANLKEELGINQNSADIITNAGDIAQIVADLAAHMADTANPHAVTKAQVGLGNVDNTSDVNKPVSTAQQTALDLKASIAYVDLLTKNAPRGHLINGKIVPSVSSNNLILALKTSAGNNPSASEPVYCKIGDTMRAITAALSWTLNAGENHANAGGAELATKEVDYFVYLGWCSSRNAVDLLASRIPFATTYNDFSYTSTNEKAVFGYTGGSVTVTDAVENIGRFAATLSAGAGYTWTVPTFTNTNLIQRPIYESRLLDFTSTPTTSGSAYTNAPTITIAKYQVIGSRVHIKIRWQYNATSGGTNASLFTIPFIAAFNYQVGYGANESNPFTLFVTTTDEAIQKMSIYKYDGNTAIINAHLCEGNLIIQI